MPKIVSIRILHINCGPDKLMMTWDIPEGTWPYTEPATSLMDVASGRGEEYVATHFPNIPYDVVVVP